MLSLEILRLLAARDTLNRSMGDAERRNEIRCEPEKRSETCLYKTRRDETRREGRTGEKEMHVNKQQFKREYEHMFHIKDEWLCLEQFGNSQVINSARKDLSAVELSRFPTHVFGPFLCEYPSSV